MIERLTDRLPVPVGGVRELIEIRLRGLNYWDPVDRPVVEALEYLERAVDDLALFCLRGRQEKGENV